jgi:hypothetical protein
MYLQKCGNFKSSNPQSVIFVEGPQIERFIPQSRLCDLLNLFAGIRSIERKIGSILWTE